MTDAEKVKMAQALKSMRENMAATIEFLNYDAEVTRAKFLALVRQGFTEQQALELCKPR